MNHALEPNPEVAPAPESHEALVAELAAALSRVAELERRVAAGDELVGRVAHELRTPVTVIRGFARLLLTERAGPLSPDQRRFVEETARSCGRLDAFATELLAGVQPGAPPAMELRDASLRETVEAVVRSLEPLLEERGLRVELEIAAERACFDPERVEQVLANLLDNALRFAPTGSCVGIETRAAGDQVEVAVVDGGSGVAETDREHIFQAGVRGGEGSHGHGLGLAICRSLVEAQGGSISVAPCPGGGSRFAFTLPAAGEAS